MACTSRLRREGLLATGCITAVHILSAMEYRTDRYVTVLLQSACTNAFDRDSGPTTTKQPSPTLVGKTIRSTAATAALGAR